MNPVTEFGGRHLDRGICENLMHVYMVTGGPPSFSGDPAASIGLPDHRILESRRSSVPFWGETTIFATVLPTKAGRLRIRKLAAGAEDQRHAGRPAHVSQGYVFV